jgi:hypothetical protein
LTSNSTPISLFFVSRDPGFALTTEISQAILTGSPGPTLCQRIQRHTAERLCGHV